MPSTGHHATMPGPFAATPRLARFQKPHRSREPERPGDGSSRPVQGRCLATAEEVTVRNVSPVPGDVDREPYSEDLMAFQPITEIEAQALTRRQLLKRGEETQAWLDRPPRSPPKREAAAERSRAPRAHLSIGRSLDLGRAPVP